MNCSRSSAVPLGSKPFLKLRLESTIWLSTAIGRLDDHLSREQQTAVSIAPSGGVGDHQQQLAGGSLEVHARTRWRNPASAVGVRMGFIIDATCYVQEMTKAAADELGRKLVKTAIAYTTRVSTSVNAVWTRGAASRPGDVRC
jgi:hypothetical protein